MPEVQMLLFWFRNMLLMVITLLVVSPPVPCHAETSTMSITLPAEVIKQSLQDILPLNIDETSRHIEGKLVLTSINKVVMGENSAVVEGLVNGENISVITRVGNQDLRIKVGNLHLPLTFDLAFRYDAKGKILYVNPRLRPPVSDSTADMANSVTSLLTLFNNREYPVSLTSLQTLNATIGNQDISVDMEPVDIRVSQGQLIVKMVPRLSKSN